MSPRTRKALLSLMIPLAFAPAVAAADDDVPALLQFAERYQQQEAPAADADTVVTPAKETQKPASRPVQTRETIAQRKQLAQLQKTLRVKETQLEQQQAALQSLQQELTALRVASSLTAADKPTPAPDLSALRDFASGVRQALNLTPQERKARAQIAEAQAALAREKQQTEERDRRIALLEQRLAALPKQSDSALQQAWQEKLAAAQAVSDKAHQRYEQDKKAATAELEQQKAEAARLTGELQQQLTQLQKERDGQRQQAGQQEKSLKTALAQQKAEAAKAVGELQQQLTQLQKESDGQRQQAGQQEKSLKAALAQLQEKHKTQTEQAKALEQRLAAVAAESAQAAQQRDKATLQADKTATELAGAHQAQQALREELDGLRSRAKWLPDVQTLKKKVEQQSYAAGVALGRDIQTMLAERKTWGINPDKTVLLAGVIDTFNGHYQLNDAQLASALAASEKAVNDARNQAAKTQTSKGEAFVAEFKKKKGTQKSPSGFWYRIDYAGDETIKDNARVDIVVKESLTDGSVIQDMDRSGKVMSQPLSAYPPLFREAIGHLKNHGSLTMVVPPALAYGETGYAPQIPPNATMVYELRIVDVGNG
ncbi:FKBP-type peptidyl-prolyl cis-trans isomerase N-terminal domain-containing protein [Serratia nevei]|uniref:FKBP-type peptidyl-prolyl cis-trans isomerase N-terminal domain-containing protein n=1 Tax=Serratia TaxID=613 RepID=UPI001CDB75EA|nr:FKBP-type peptidyl-prolyl cis-trans isomerase N-terminal domain-containing protein [Serratia marcescens]MCA4113696.1 FKBP-type peptidyl-prolyl cis-trans isomerase [Serratia marcescens]